MGTTDKQIEQKEKIMHWAGIIVAVLGLVYAGVKDYSNGTLKIPTYQTEQTTQAEPILYPLQYCTMAYDPNTDKVWYQGEDGVWRDTPPAQKKVGEYYH